MPQDRYQTVQEVADRLRVSEATVRHWIRDGDLRAIDIGKGWRVSDADLEDFLRRHETRPRETSSQDQLRCPGPELSTMPDRSSIDASPPTRRNT
ncbi:MULTISPECIES: helix-turn-helix domain-containing protein [Pseudorhizobium]|uniref:helix-turn-helix domain-containing protein n=1 Tax=Pseudorhizobium TaxID=1903858 RepID=UPI000987D36F|nr:MULTISPECIES: helix-turn-helix domain-containing protein [Pseudorhizobium]